MLPSYHSQRDFLKIELTYNTLELKPSKIAACCTQSKVLLPCLVLWGFTRSSTCYFLTSVSPTISLYPDTLDNLYFLKMSYFSPHYAFFSSDFLTWDACPGSWPCIAPFFFRAQLICYFLSLHLNCSLPITIHFISPVFLPSQQLFEFILFVYSL